MWSLDSGEKLCTLHGHIDVTCVQFDDFIDVTCVQFDDYQTASGSYDMTVRLCDFGAY